MTEVPNDPNDPTLHCYECEHEYRYLGRSPHPGCCTDCGSRLVTPASGLRIITSKLETDAARTLVEIKLVGRDDIVG
jgi:ribosomal protein S27E